MGDKPSGAFFIGRNFMTATLANGTQIPIQSYHIPLDVVFLCDDPDDLLTVWGQFAAEGALDVLVISDDDHTLGSYYGCKISGIQAVNNPDGTLTGHIYMYETGTAPESSGLTPEDEAYITAAKILLGEEA